MIVKKPSNNSFSNIAFIIFTSVLLIGALTIRIDNISFANTYPSESDTIKMTLKEFGQYQNIKPNYIINTLRINGIIVENIEQSINEISNKNKILPNVILKLIENSSDDKTPIAEEKNNKKPILLSPQNTQKKANKGRGDGLGKSYGQMTLEDLCSNLNVSIKDAKKNLKDKGIIISNSNIELRDIAAKYNTRPRDIVEIIQIKPNRFFKFW